MLWLHTIVCYLILVTSCAQVQETEAEHFERDYLAAEVPSLHGYGISYEHLGILQKGQWVSVGVRDDTCKRRIVRGQFLDIDMRAYACNTDCRLYRAVTLYDRTMLLPYHSIFRGIGYEQLIASPFINAEMYLLHNGDTLAIPLWQVDAIVPHQAD